MHGGFASPPAVVCVLAGGLARRMGASKAGVELAGRPLISYPLAAAAAAGLEALVVAKPDTPLPELCVPLLREPALPLHPLCGVLAALRHVDQAAGARPERARAVLAVPCDMPFLDAGLLAWIAALDRPVVADVQGRCQPLPTLCHPADAPLLERALRRGDSMRAALRALDAHVIDEQALRSFGDPPLMYTRVNDPGQLRAAAAVLTS